MNASTCQYTGHCYENSGSLPFTGFDVGILVAVALIVIIVGLLLRRA